MHVLSVLLLSLILDNILSYKVYKNSIDQLLVLILFHNRYNSSHAHLAIANYPISRTNRNRVHKTKDRSALAQPSKDIFFPPDLKKPRFAMEFDLLRHILWVTAKSYG